MRGGSAWSRPNTLMQGHYSWACLAAAPPSSVTERSLCGPQGSEKGTDRPDEQRWQPALLQPCPLVQWHSSGLNFVSKACES